MYTRLRIMYQLFLYILFKLQFFLNILEEPSYKLNFIKIRRVRDGQKDRKNRRTHGRMDRCWNRHKGANNRISKLSNILKEAGILAQALRSTRSRAGRLRDHSRIPRISKLFLSLGVSQA
jgi:hypothetical protein